MKGNVPTAQVCSDSLLSFSKSSADASHCNYQGVNIQKNTEKLRKGIILFGKLPSTLKDKDNNKLSNLKPESIKYLGIFYLKIA